MAKKSKKNEPKEVHELTDKELLKLGRNVRDMYEFGYLRIGHMMWYNLLRGIAYGFGLFLGGTIVVALVVWILGFFEQVPMIQPLVDAVLKAINVANTGN